VIFVQELSSGVGPRNSGLGAGGLKEGERRERKRGKREEEGEEGGRRRKREEEVGIGREEEGEEKKKKNHLPGILLLYKERSTRSDSLHSHKKSFVKISKNPTITSNGYGFFCHVNKFSKHEAVDTSL
jgi:hypothetical protein